MTEENPASSRPADAPATRRRSRECGGRTEAPPERNVRQAMEAARRLRRDVAIATGTLAELYRGAGRNQALDALLARESGDGLVLRDTDRTLAPLIGALLSE